MRPIIAGRAELAWMLVRRRRFRSRMCSMRRGASVISRSSCVMRCRRHCGRAWASGCLGATCVKTFVLGIRGRRSVRQVEFEPRSNSNPMDLIGLFELDEAAFRERFRHTPLWRPRRRGLLRNAAIVLGNRPTTPAIPALIRGLNDVEPLVRGACAWALGRYRRECSY